MAAARRVVIMNSVAGLKIVVPAPKKLFVLFVFPIWLAVWVVGEVMIPYQVFTAEVGRTLRQFMLVWMVLWTAVGVFAIFVWLWNMFGREEIVIDGYLLEMRKGLFGWGVPQEYELPQVRNLRVQPAPFQPFNFVSSLQFWGIGGGTIAFDYEEETVYFGSGVDEAEATVIVNNIRNNYKLSSDPAAKA